MDKYENSRAADFDMDLHADSADANSHPDVGCGRHQDDPDEDAGHGACGYAGCPAHADRDPYTRAAHTDKDTYLNPHPSAHPHPDGNLHADSDLHTRAADADKYIDSDAHSSAYANAHSDDRCRPDGV